MLAHRLWNGGVWGPSASQLNRFWQVSRAWEDYGAAETPVARTRLLSAAGGMCLHTTTGPGAARPGQHDREADRHVYKQCWLPECHSVGSQECPSPVLCEKHPHPPGGSQRPTGLREAKLRRSSCRKLCLPAPQTTSTVKQGPRPQAPARKPRAHLAGG